LPIMAIASNRASLARAESTDGYSSDQLIPCQDLDPAPRRPALFFRQLLNDESACASYLLGCKSRGQLAVVDPHVDLVDEYVALADAQGVPIVAVFETHVQADHVSGLPELTARTGAATYLPAGAGVEFNHHPLRDGEVVHLGDTEFQAIATPGHAQAHHAYLVTDHARADDPWMVLTGDALLVGDAGRPDLHAHSESSVEEMAGSLYRSLTEGLLSLPDHLIMYPAHYAGSVCGRGLSAHPASTIGFERRHNPALQHDSEEAFVESLIRDMPPAPERQAEIVAANRAGRRVPSSTAV
jgi:hydroxyacylglutathione hydrolase